MEERDIAIYIAGLKKRYRLGVIGGGTLQGDIQSWLARKLGKEDPNSKIGSKVYSKNASFYALDGIDLTIYKGERVGIIGHNGAGKSTLLKLLSRVTAPTEGKIYIDGRISSMLEVGTGFNGELTGRENIYMNGAILGMSKAEVESKIEAIIEFSECRQFIDTPVKRYSSGMYVKLAFAVSAHLDNEILIMDEVLAVGDMAFQRKCIEKMNEVSKKQGKTVLYVSHNMSTIRQLCEKSIVMDHGKIIFEGDVETGINIYSGNNRTENMVFYDFSSSPRPSKQHGKKIFINYLQFLGKEYSVFDKREKMMFRIGFDAKENLSELKLYFVIKRSEERIGMAQTYESIAAVSCGKHYDYDFEFDISNLAPGKYSFIPDIFSEDGTGRHLSYDHPLYDVFFEVIDNNPVGLRWLYPYYGNVSFSPILFCKSEYLEKK